MGKSCVVVGAIGLLISSAAALGQNCSPQAIGQTGGGTVAVARVSNTLVATGVGSEYELVNVSANPPVINGSVEMGKPIVNIDAAGNFSYVLLEDQIVVVDHSVPGSPLPLIQAPVPGDATLANASAIDVSGTRAVVTRGNLLHIYDISLPQVPSLQGTYSPGLIGQFKDVALVGNLAYAASYNDEGDTGFVTILDVSNAASPVFRGLVSFFSNPYGVAVSGTTLYVAFAGPSSSTTFRSYNVSNPASPVQNAGFGSLGGRATRIAADANFVYAAMGSDGAAAVDFSTAGAPVVAWTNATQGFAADVAVNTATRRLFLADTEGGLRVFNTTVPGAPASAGSTRHHPGKALDLVVNDAGTFAFVADRNAGLKVFSIVNPANPSLSATLSLLGRCGSLARSGNLLFVASSQGLHAVDVTNPANPIFRSTAAAGSSISSVAAAGTIVYVTVGTSLLRVYNAANPAAMVQIGEVPLFSSGAILYCTRVSGTRLAVVQHNYLEFFDVSNPAAPVLRSTINMFLSDVKMSGNYAYVAGWGLRIYDISSLAAPVGTAPMVPVISMRSVSLVGPNATTIDHEGRMHYFSIADPDRPRHLHTSMPLGIDPQALVQVGITMHLADGSGGYRTMERFTFHPPVSSTPLPTEATLMGTMCERSFTATFISMPAPTGYAWRLNGALLHDGPGAFGVVASGSTTNTITLSNVQPGAFGPGGVLDLTCTATNQCGTSPQAVVADIGSCAADFNCDGFVNPDDLADFITCFFLDVQFVGFCPGADFNGDGFRNPDDLADFITTFFLAVQFGC